MPSAALPSQIQMFLKTKEGNDLLTLDVDPVASIESVKARIQALLGEDEYDAWSQVLFFGQLLLQDDRLLSDCNIVHDSILTLVTPAELLSQLQLCVVSLHGEELLKLDMGPFDLIKNLKCKVQERAGIDVREQRLFFDHQPLEDDHRTLVECKVLRDSTITLVKVEYRFKVHVEVRQSGKPLTVNVRGSDTVGSLKLMVQDMDSALKRLPAGKLSLKHAQQELRDELALFGANVNEEAILHLRVIGNCLPRRR